MNFNTFWNKVAIRSEDECWLWLGATNEEGYGVYYPDNSPYNPRKKHKLQAHRVAYLTSKGGGIPDGLIVCHTCDVPRCCNPDHMFLGTDQDNYDDALAKGRTAPQFRRKLTPEQVRAIRASKESSRSLAEIHGVTKNVVAQVLRGTTYKWVS